MDKKEEEQYLPEDKDLLEALSKIPISDLDNTPTNKTNRLTIVQIKAALRNRKTAHDLDDSTKKYSLVLIAFALAQLALGVFEFLFNAEFSGHVAVGIFYVILITALIAYILGTAFKNIEKR